MTKERSANVPIGYWIRRADELLTARVDDVQRVNGLSRLEWQVLNVFHEAGTATFERLAAVLQPFADAAGLVEVIERLVRRELIEPADGGSSYRVTNAGERLHGAALEAQTALRRRAVAGVAEDDYTTAIRVLQRIVENLRDEAAP